MKRSCFERKGLLSPPPLQVQIKPLPNSTGHSRPCSPGYSPVKGAGKAGFALILVVTLAILLSLLATGILTLASAS
jgi:hypothetical protein